MSIDPTATNDESRGDSGPAQPSLPPHLARLALTDLTADQFDAFQRVGDRGFQEETPAEIIALERAASDPSRFFGFTVGDRWVSTFGSFARTLTLPGGAAMPVSAVTAVTVHTAYRRRGLLRQSMAEEFRRCRERGEALAVLYASESSIYGQFGYANAASKVKLSGRTQALRLRPDVADALRTTVGSVDEVERAAFVPLVRDLRDRIAARTPGSLDRPDIWWQIALADPTAWRGGATALRFVVCYADDGSVNGYATYRVHDNAAALNGNPAGEVRIGEVDADTPAAHARLWQYLTSLDLVRTFSVSRASTQHALQFLVTDPRAISTQLRDSLYVRVLDVAAALSARRYAAPIDVVIEVRDDVLPDGGGTFALRGGPDGAIASRSDRQPDMTLSIRELGAAYLGETALSALHAAGLVDEHRSGSVAASSTAFGWPTAPFCADAF